MWMVFPALLLFAAGSFLELKTVFSIRRLKALIHRQPILGVVVSILIALGLGSLFNVGGTIVFLGAMMTTAFTQTVYTAASKVEKSGVEFRNSLEEAWQVVRPIAMIIKWIFLIATAPIWLYIKYRRWRMRNNPQVARPSTTIPQGV